MNYGPLKFLPDHPEDWIPAVPDPTDNRQRRVKEECPGFDATQPSTARDPVMGVLYRRELPDDPRWNAEKLKLGFDAKTNELHWFFFGNSIRGAEFNKTYAHYRKLLKEARQANRVDPNARIRKNVLWLSRYTVEQQIYQLRLNGYERSAGRESGHDLSNPRYSCLCFVQQVARQWRESRTSVVEDEEE